MHQEQKSSFIVLLSSGLDSSVNLAFALNEGQVKLALTFDYGQMAAERECESAKALCQKHGIPHQLIDLKWFTNFSNSALNEKQALPVDSQVSLENKEKSLESAKRVWVPNRNGIFLNIAAGFAEGLGAEFVVPGFNREEAETFPDNSKEFLNRLNQAFKFSTASQIQVKCFTTDLDKAEIVSKGIKLGVDFSKLWPCYQNQKRWCGVCESCQRYSRALKKNGLSFSELNQEK